VGSPEQGGPPRCACCPDCPEIYGSRFFDILLLDSLYAQTLVLQLAEEIDWDLVITLKQENRALYQGARACFRAEHPATHRKAWPQHCRSTNWQAEVGAVSMVALSRKGVIFSCSCSSIYSHLSHLQSLLALYN
jgi:hypothetical protein